MGQIERRSKEVEEMGKERKEDHPPPIFKKQRA